MIAVTIGIGRDYQRLAELAAESCRAATGLETLILDESHYRKYGIVGSPMLLRYHLVDEFPNVDSILHFDADMVFMKPFDAHRLANSGALVAVRDCYSQPWIRSAAQAIGISAKTYFNGGFLVMDPRRHGPLLRLARNYERTATVGFQAQCALNWARMITDEPVNYLPKYYNYIRFFAQPDWRKTLVGHFISSNISTCDNATKESVFEAYAQEKRQHPLFANANRQA